MGERWWYVRHGIAWLPLLGCCAAAAATAGVLARWPSTAFGVLPVLLACCAAAAAFVFDEGAAPVVAVTPRGATWRRTARLAVALVPLAVWTLVVLVRPGELALDRRGWWLVGAAAIAFSVGLAALASRHEVDAPGSLLAALVALAMIGPVVVAGFFGADTVYPIEGFSSGVRSFWLAVAACGAGACLLALRPGMQR